MTQGDVLYILKLDPDNWYTNEAIANKLGVNTNAIRANTKILRRCNFVKYKYNGDRYKEFIHKYKR